MKQVFDFKPQQGIGDEKKSKNQTVKAEKESEKEAVKLYDDSELGRQDLFFRDKQGKLHKNINWEELHFNHKFNWLRSKILDQLRAKGIGESSEIYQKLDKNLFDLATKTEPERVKQAIQQEASQVRSWLEGEQTLTDQEKNVKAYLDAQESLFCLMEAYSRVYRRQLEELKKIRNDSATTGLEEKIKEIFSDEKMFEPQMKDAYPGKIPTKEDSLVLQVAFAIEDGRKQDPVDNLEEKTTEKATENFYPPVVSEKAGLPEKINDTNSKEEKIHKLNLVAMDQVVKSMAWRVAEEKVRQLLHKPEEGTHSSSRWQSIWNNLRSNLRNPKEFLKKSWVRMAEEGYREKFYQEALEEITQNQDLLREIEADYKFSSRSSGVGGNKERHYMILDKEIERYQKDVEELEERGNNLTDPEVNLRFQELISRHCIENWDRDRFEAEQKKLIIDLKKQGKITNADFLGVSQRKASEIDEGRMFASNLFQIAEGKKIEMQATMAEIFAEHKLSPEQQAKVKEYVDSTMKLDIHLGAALTDLQNQRPEGQLGVLTKGFAWMQSRPLLGRMVGNPGSAAVLGAVAGGFISRWATRGLATAGLATAGVVTGAWIPVLSVAASAGLVSGLRRNLELKKDRAMHQRQRALGNKADDYRRRNMDRFNYDTRSTEEMLKVLVDLKKEQPDGTFKNKEYNELDSSQKQFLADMLARFDIERGRAREFRKTGKNRTVDLITVSQEEGQAYKTNILSKADIEIGLKLFLRENGLIDGNNTLVSNESNEEFLQLFNENRNRLINNINEADRRADQYRRKSVATMTGIGVAFGAIGSMAGQHIVDYFREGTTYTATDNLKDILRGGGHLDDLSKQISGKINLNNALIGHLMPGQLNTINVGGDKLEIFFKPDGSGIDLGKSNLPNGWTTDGESLFHTIKGADSLRLDGKEMAITPGQSAVFDVNGNGIKLYFNGQGAIDVEKTNNALAQLNSRGTWKLSADGKELTQTIFNDVIKPPDFSQPVKITNFGQNVPDFNLYFNSNGSLNIDEINKNLSDGWRISDDGTKLIQEVAGAPKPVNTVDDFKEFAQSLGVNYDETQRISYRGFFDQRIASDKGIRALPETTKNILNNLKLHADSTELGMRYIQDQEGNVIVDITKMIDAKTLNGMGVSQEDIRQLLTEGKIKMGLSLDNSTGGTQHNPIILEMDATGKIKVPKNIAKLFFAFDQEGKLLQGAGKHPGLHSLFYDTGEMVNTKGGLANKVIGIAHTYGERPELTIPVTSTREVAFNPYDFQPDKIVEKQTMIERYPLERTVSSPQEEVYQIISGDKLNTPDAMPIVGPASRWQLEGEDKKKEQEKTVKYLVNEKMIKENKNLKQLTENDLKKNKNKKESFQKNELLNKETIKNKREEYTLDESKLDEFWNNNKDRLLNVENLKKIIPALQKENANVKDVLEKLFERLRKFEIIMGQDNAEAGMIEQEITDYRDKFMELYPEEKVSNNLMFYSLGLAIIHYLNFYKNKQEIEVEQKTEEKENEYYLDEKDKRDFWKKHKNKFTGLDNLRDIIPELKVRNTDTNHYLSDLWRQFNRFEQISNKKSGEYQALDQTIKKVFKKQFVKKYPQLEISNAQIFYGLKSAIADYFNGSNNV